MDSISRKPNLSRKAMQDVQSAEKQAVKQPASKRHVPPHQLHQAQPEEEQEELKPRKAWRIIKYVLGIGFAIAALVLVVLFVRWARDTADTYVEDAHVAFEQQLYSEALEKYQYAAALQAFNSKAASEAFAGVGDILLLKNQSEEAERYYMYATEEDPSNGNFRYNYARILFDNGKSHEAATQLGEIDDKNSEALILAGRVAMRQGDFDRAYDYFADAKEDETGEAIYYQGLVAAAREDDDAARTLREAVDNADDTNFGNKAERFLKTYEDMRSNSKSLTAFQFAKLASLYLENGEPDLALWMADEALELETPYRDASAIRAASYFERKEYDYAEKTVLETLEISPLKPNLNYLAGQVLFQQGRLEEAREYFERAEELGMKTAEFYTNYADLYQDLGEDEQELDYVKKARKTNVDGYSVNNRLLWEYIERDDLDGIKRQAEYLAENFDTDSFSHAARAYAKLLMRKSETDIQENLEEAEKHSGNQAMTFYVQALLEENDDAGEARELLIMAIDHDISGNVAKIAKEKLDEMRDETIKSPIDID
ncbi:tetratricopeptide repeat protein [Patescibacteria group bacterium]